MKPLKRWRELLLAKEDRFLHYLSEQAAVTAAGVRLLCAFVHLQPQGEARDRAVAEMSRLEEAGDRIRRKIVAELLEAFVTPLDREDIYALSRSVDDILDYADTTVQELVLYDVAATPAMREMVRVLRVAAEDLEQAIALMGRQPRRAIAHMVRAKRAENTIEDLYRRANAELFASTDVHYIFKVREVYRHLSNGADRADEAADIIGEIVIKGNV
ncbi:MAG: DUF47 family protein [Alicyclobacillus sp.]|nr:DUF47 family protein [Alicyclobacillus sp.]